MKFCWRCKQEKSEFEFGRDSSRSDGIQCTCKRCRTELARAWRERNPGHRERWTRTPKQEDHQRRWRAKNPEKWKAHQAVAHAVRTGKLVREDICALCSSSEGRMQAHHEDYDELLSVEWLCARCHTRLHAGVPL